MLNISRVIYIKFRYSVPYPKSEGAASLLKSWSQMYNTLLPFSSSKSGCVTSIPVSITPTITPLPWNSYRDKHILYELDPLVLMILLYPAAWALDKKHL
ncbi:MAG: hypothetical protein U5K00_19065 [Melioribacteraceae bacterium]|nr:hypothetical protein [Melioribacteraceae bacterium]